MQLGILTGSEEISTDNQLRFLLKPRLFLIGGWGWLAVTIFPTIVAKTLPLILFIAVNLTSLLGCPE